LDLHASGAQKVIIRRRKFTLDLLLVEVNNQSWATVYRTMQGLAVESEIDQALQEQRAQGILELSRGLMEARDQHRRS
jgi:hypothetical protein